MEGELSLDTVEKIKNEDGEERNTLVRKGTQGQPVFVYKPGRRSSW